MKQHSMTLGELEALLQGKLQGNKEHIISGVADIGNANESEATFLAHSRYQNQLETTSAGLILIDGKTTAPEGKNVLITENPSLAFQTLIEEFHKQTHTEKSAFSGIHPSAVIAESATIGKNVTIGPFVCIDNGVTIGDNTRIDSGCSIGVGVSIGSDCYFHSNVVIREWCTIGSRVILHPGCVIGDCGFGYHQNQKRHHIKLNQLGTVILEDDVEVNSNSCVDRARFTATRVGQGTKIDNMVYVGHGVTIGKHCLIVGQTGIAGSTVIGDHVMIGGHVAIDGHLEICSKTMIAAIAKVTKSITKPGIYGGIPAMPWKEFKVLIANLKSLEQFKARLNALEAQKA